MSIQMKGGKPASEQAIIGIERAVGCPLSSSFREFLAESDGAEPDSNVFPVGDKCESSVRQFIPAAEVLQDRRCIGALPPKAYPVARDDCGNFVFVDEERGGAVFFWDHEMPEHSIELAPSFEAFLDLLKPFDASTIQLKPGQVKRVWVDPEFLKKLPK